MTWDIFENHGYYISQNSLCVCDKFINLCGRFPWYWEESKDKFSKLIMADIKHKSSLDKSNLERDILEKHNDNNMMQHDLW